MKKVAVLLILMSLVFGANLGLNKKQIIAKYGNDYGYEVSAVSEKLTYIKHKLGLFFIDDKVYMEIHYQEFPDYESYNKARGDLLANRGKMTRLFIDDYGNTLFDMEKKIMYTMITDENGSRINTTYIVDKEFKEFLEYKLQEEASRLEETE